MAEYCDAALLHVLQSQPLQMSSAQGLVVTCVSNRECVYSKSVQIICDSLMHSDAPVCEPIPRMKTLDKEIIVDQFEGL